MRSLLALLLSLLIVLGASTVRADPAPDRPGQTMRRAGIAVTGVGIGFVAIALVGLLLVVTAPNDCPDICGQTILGAYMGLAGGIVGTVGLAVGIPLWLVGNDRMKASEARVSFAPLPGAHGLGGGALRLSVAF